MFKYETLKWMAQEKPSPGDFVLVDLVSQTARPWSAHGTMNQLLAGELGFPGGVMAESFEEDNTVLIMLLGE